MIVTEDERSIANRLANEEKKSEDDVGRTSMKAAKTDEQKLSERDPTAPVRKTWGNSSCVNPTDERLGRSPQRLS